MDMERIKGGFSSNFTYKGATTHPTLTRKKEEFDPRVYRPLEVTVSATLHDIRGHLLKVRDSCDLYIVRLSFIMLVL